MMERKIVCDLNLVSVDFGREEELRPGNTFRISLLGPIRPTRRDIAISPHGGLYAVSSLCGSASATREWFRAFAAVLS
jgi:hypothetical protein